MLTVVGDLAQTPTKTEDRRANPALRWRPYVPRIVAYVMRLTSVLTVLGILLPESRQHFSSAAADAMGDGLAFATASVAAGLQFVLAGAVRRRRRRAWWLAVIVVSIGICAHIKAGSRWVLLLNALLLVLLLWSRRDFTARSEPGTRWNAVRAFVLMAAVSLTAGMFLTRHTAPRSPWSDRFTETFFGLLGFAPNLKFREPQLSALTEVALTTMGAATALVTFLVVLAPARKRAHLDPDTAKRLRALLQRFGDRDSLGYFALRDDKTAIFSPSGKAAIAYRVVAGVSLASGDPLGDPEAWPPAIEEWIAEADSYAWVPGVIGCSEEAARAYVRAGFDALEIGDEAVIDLADFSFSGRSMRVVRQAVRRVERAGYKATVHRQCELGKAEIEEAVAAADRFRDGETERGFSMALSRLGDPSDPDVVLVRARDEQGRLVGLLCFVPWGCDGLSLDLMRRSRDSENGTVEFMVAALVDKAGELGVRRVSLNFAVFRSAFDRGGRVGAGPVMRVWRQVLLLASRWWQIESLYRANAKYNPEWVPRFVCFRRATELPRVTLGALEAEAFLMRPRLFRRYG